MTSIDKDVVGRRNNCTTGRFTQQSSYKGYAVGKNYLSLAKNFFKQLFFIKISALKGQSNEIFYPQFISSFELVWATDKWVTIFSFLV